MREPLNDNSTDAKRALNRRVELTILTSEKF
jgi:flagellar motor protein MotB